MILCFSADLIPKVEIKMNGVDLFCDYAPEQFKVKSYSNKGQLSVKMFDKNPTSQPQGKDKHIRLTHIEFNNLVLDEMEIYKLYNPTVKDEKTLYLGYNVPDSLEIKLEHPHNILIKRLALLSER